MKIVAFGASTSKKSINKTLASYASSFIKDADVEVLDLNDFELPVFSQDLAEELGQPQAAKDLFEKIRSSDGIVVSLAEHNGSYTAAYKNIFDWMSKIEQKVYQDKPVVYLSTSPGPAGASSVLATATQSAHHFGVDLIDTVSVPSFYDVFDFQTMSISNPDISNAVQAAMGKLAKRASIGASELPHNASMQKEEDHVE